MFVCPLTLLNVASAKPNFTSWSIPVLVLDMIELLPPLGLNKYDTGRILPVKCYIDNFVHLRSCIRNINRHFLHHYRGGSQYSLSIYRLLRIVLVSIISPT
jgi:hypothetical protein